MSDTSRERPPRCMHLTCKSMMVFGEDFEQDEDFKAGLVELECTKTFTNIGPDKGEAGLELCSNPRRTCYREY